MVPCNMDLLLPEMEEEILAYFDIDLDEVDKLSHELRLWKRLGSESKSKSCTLKVAATRGVL